MLSANDLSVDNLVKCTKKSKQVYCKVFHIYKKKTPQNTSQVYQNYIDIRSEVVIPTYYRNIYRSPLRQLCSQPVILEAVSVHPDCFLRS